MMSGSVSTQPDDPPIQECHAAAQDNIHFEVDSPNKGTHAKERQAPQNEKIKQQLRFFEDVTLGDVTIDEDNLIPLFANSASRTMVQGIKGVEPSKIGAKVLAQICRFLKLNNYNAKSKLVMLGMIGERKKNEHLEVKMYNDDFVETATTDARKKQPKQKKGTRPKEVREDGSLYRLILTFFLQKHRHLVTQIGTNPSAAQLGSNKFLHERIYNVLSASYNNKDEPNISSMNLDDDTYTAAGLTETAPSQFDKMTGALFSQTLDFINKQYKLAFEKSKRSGHHHDFSCYCSGTPWVLLYHNNLMETGDSILNDLVHADLSDDVKRGFVGDTPSRKRKTPPARTVASRIISPQQFALDRIVDLTSERHAESAAMNQLKAKRIKLTTDKEALSLHSSYRDMIYRERKRLKDLRLEDDYKSDGSEAGEIRNAITVLQ